MKQNNVIKFPLPANDHLVDAFIEQREFTMTPQEMLNWMALEEDVYNVLVIAERRDGTISVVCNKSNIDETMNLIDLGIDTISRSEDF